MGRTPWSNEPSWEGERVSFTRPDRRVARLTCLKAATERSSDPHEQVGQVSAALTLTCFPLAVLVIVMYLPQCAPLAT